MTQVLDASELSLHQVYRHLHFEEQFVQDFTTLLSLDPLTESEQKRLEEIRSNFRAYYQDGKILEGEVKFLCLAPLMWLSGFYHPNIRISLEEGIEKIQIQENDIEIKGRLDILAAQRVETEEIALWILLIESKRTRFDTAEGLPQLLAYTYNCLEYQETVWGLTTNGKNYQFVHIKQGEFPIYQLLPELNLIRPEQSVQLLQVMKAICQPFVTS